MLNKAVTTAPRMILARRQVGRDDQRQLYYKDRQWENSGREQPQSGCSTERWMPTSVRHSSRSPIPAPQLWLCIRPVPAQKYPYTSRDNTGKFLDGSNTYKLHLPPNPPAALFWAVTAYNITDGTMPETDQLLPSTNGYYNIPKNSDGSIDLGSARTSRMA